MWLPGLLLTKTGQGVDGPVTVSKQLGVEQMVDIEDVVIEKRMGNVVPDLIAKVKGKTLLIEIAVTNFVGEEKLERVRSAQLPMLEIDLSDISRSAEREIIRTAVVEGQGLKNWVYTPKAALCEEELAKSLKEEINRQEKMRRIGRLRHRDDDAFRVLNNELNPGVRGETGSERKAERAGRGLSREVIEGGQNVARVLRVAQEGRLKGVHNYSCRSCCARFVYPKDSPVEEVTCLRCSSKDVVKDT